MPVTHIGRAACVVVMLFMPIIIAFITASTTKKISLTPDEATLMVNIDSNHLLRHATARNTVDIYSIHPPLKIHPPLSVPKP